VVVVEHEDYPLSKRLELVDERRHDVLQEARAGRSKESQGLGSDIGLDDPDRLDDKRPETPRVVVPAVDREPERLSLVPSELLPAGDQRRLA
jgi:hypothetical protein